MTDPIVSNTINELLTEIKERTRIIDRDVAHHPDTVRRVLSGLDAAGPSEAGDVIHSLLWRCAILEDRSRRFGKALSQRIHDECSD